MSLFPVRRRPVRSQHQMLHIPAPTGGLNTVMAASEMPPTDCMSVYNLVAGQYGLRTRLGEREWCTGLTGSADNQVRTLLPFTGSAKSGANDRLFAATSTGIWDVSASSASPTQVQAFGTTSGSAGFGVSTVFVTSAGHFLVYCDEVNGAFIYAENSTTWAALSVTGVSAASLCYVTVFKNRLWFVERDTATAWYLAAASISGAATSFAMGRNFKRGGPLVGLYNWTYDGGAGLDDSLVAVSGGGDVLVWQLTDPDTPAGTLLKGVWYAGGAPPEGRNIATNFGGDLLLLTRVGAIPMSRLVLGSNIAADQYATAKIANLFNELMLTRASKKGWAMHLHPEESTLVVVVPTNDGYATEQLCMALANRAWSRYRDLPVYCAAVWGGKLYFGTVDGRVEINDGNVDGVTLANPSSYTEIEWSCTTAFNHFGSVAQKQVQLLKPKFLDQGAGSQYVAAARYDFDLTEATGIPAGTVGSGEWDGDTWDSAVWGGEYAPTQATLGAVGMGVHVAVAVAGRSTSRLSWVGTDVVYTSGGIL